MYFSVIGETNILETSTSESEKEEKENLKETLRKRNTSLRALSRKSDSNAFSTYCSQWNVLKTSNDSDAVNRDLIKKERLILKELTKSSNTVQNRVHLEKHILDSHSNFRTSPDILKSRPNIFKRSTDEGTVEENAFQDTLAENVSSNNVMGPNNEDNYKTELGHKSLAGTNLHTQK